MTNTDLNSDVERKPNPKGWVPPKAPYNPYDPSDLRPPEGYPSEFKPPGQLPWGFSSIPRSPTQYQKVNETMKKLNYTPRPASELYPGQYKVLRKVDTNSRLNAGSRYFGTLIMGALTLYLLFFYRWNDGNENVTSSFYRAQLRVREHLFGLSEIEYDDLYHPKAGARTVRSVRDTDYVPEPMRRTVETEYALNRPSERHVLEAHRIQQEREEKMLRDLDMHKQFAAELVRDGLVPEPAPHDKRKKWFWIF